MLGLCARKIGMTRVFEDDGRQTPVTVLEVGPCVVVQRKTAEKDGYDAVQCGFCDRKESRTTKPMAGHFKKAGCSPKQYLREFGVDPSETWKAGDELTVAVFEGVTHVDVKGTTKGRGFQGVVKRHGMGGGPATHGGHSKRRPGSVGQKEEPARIWKGKSMPGHMGNDRITAQNLRIVKILPEENLMLVNGAVAGPVGGILAVEKALKKTVKKS